MSIVTNEDGSPFGIVNGWAPIVGGGKAVNLTVFLSSTDVRRLKRFRKGKELKQDDVGYFLLACIGTAIDAWALTHGYQKKPTERGDMLLEYTGDK